MRRLPALALASCAFLAAASPAAAQRPAPEGMIGIAPQTILSERDMELLTQARVRSLRLPLSWFEIEARRPWRSPRDWSSFEYGLMRAASKGMRVLPFAWGTPSWVAAHPQVEPSFSRFSRRRWSSFLRRAVRRYGPGGTFWQAHPELPARPIRWWQLWNEPNIVSFSSRPSGRGYARLAKVSARAIRSVDPRARLVAAGLFGQPLQSPPNVPPERFLRRAFKRTGLKHVIDAVALHPYVPRARQIPERVRSLRRVLRHFGVPRMPLWITEMGWGSDSGESRWERGWRGQARELNTAMRILVGSRRRWKVKRIYWYSWIDAPVCLFCDSAGLFTRRRRPKPAWFAFNSWTGGYAGLPSQPREASRLRRPRRR